MTVWHQAATHSGRERYELRCGVLLLIVEAQIDGRWIGWVGNHIGNCQFYPTRSDAERAALRAAWRLLRITTKALDAIDAEGKD